MWRHRITHLSHGKTNSCFSLRASLTMTLSRNHPDPERLCPIVTRCGLRISTASISNKSIWTNRMLLEKNKKSNWGSKASWYTHVVLFEFVDAVCARVLQLPTSSVAALALHTDVHVWVGACAETVASVHFHVVLEHYHGNTQLISCNHSFCTSSSLCKPGSGFSVLLPSRDVSGSSSIPSRSLSSSIQSDRSFSKTNSPLECGSWTLTYMKARFQLK